MKAALLIGPEKIMMDAVAEPHPAAGDAVIQPTCAGICGTDVSLYLGHKSIKTTEKHYAPFVKARQEKMVDELKGVWIKTGVEYTQQHKQCPSASPLRSRSNNSSRPAHRET